MASDDSSVSQNENCHSFDLYNDFLLVVVECKIRFVISWNRLMNQIMLQHNVVQQNSSLYRQIALAIHFLAWKKSVNVCVITVSYKNYLNTLSYQYSLSLFYINYN